MLLKLLMVDVMVMVDGDWWMVDGDVNVDDNVKWGKALCGCSALSPKRRHQRKINQQRDVAKCFFGKNIVYHFPNKIFKNLLRI